MQSEEIKKSYFKVKTSTVEHMRDLLHDIKSNKDIDLEARVRELEEELENLRNAKKYGLVWDAEKEPEQVVLDCQNKLPILKEVKDRKILSDDSWDSNILIEWDNYHSLQVLNYTHKEAIDVIYIDPPYNTGKLNDWKTDFFYNDKYIQKDDTYRHSKWLNFIEKRLSLSYNLLKESWVIFISIDDNEHSQVKLLCDEIFWEENFVASLPTIMNLKGNNDEFGFSWTHEYTLVYIKNINYWTINQYKINSEELESWEEDDIWMYKKWAPLRATWAEATRQHRPKMFYPLLLKDGVLTAIKQEEFDSIYSKEEKKFNDIALDKVKNKYEKLWHTVILPMIDSKNYWRWRWWYSQENIKRLESDVIINSSGWLYKKQRPELWNLPTKKPKSIFYKPEYSSWNWTTQLKNIFWKKVFNNPKPIDLVKDFLILGWTNESIILDFMAWSGTTWHAVLDLNKEDWGNRKFILCTNNENNICEEVTYERVKKVSQWYTNAKWKEVEWLGWNLRYYKTGFVEVDDLKDITDEKKLELTYNAGELLAIKEWIYNERNKTDYGQVFENTSDIVAVYFKESTMNLEEMADELAKIQKEKWGQVIWYIYGNPYKTESFPQIENLVLKDIPDPILKVYREINKV